MHPSRILLPVLALAFVAAPAASQAPVDLSSWTAESYMAVSGFGAGQWNVAAGGQSVTQTINGQPTLFYSPFPAFNTQAQGQIMVASAGDDDYIGFALGFNPGDAANPAADYLLVDWKRGTQSFNFGTPSCTPGSLAPVGLAVSRVTGIPTADEFWGHVNLDTAPCSGPGDGLVELARAATLGSAPWVVNTTYNFQFEFTATQLRVFVNGALELNVAGLFNNGRLAFYNFSQAAVTYSAYTVNCPASWASYGTGFPGTLGIPQLTLGGNPVLGTTTSIDLLSANPVVTTGIAAIGFAPAAIPTSFGGTLWVQPVDLIVFDLPPGAASLPLAVPTDPLFCGTAFYLQLAHFDPGATSGIAFSPGLEIVFGF